MIQNNVVQITQFRDEKKNKRDIDRLNAGKKGSIYSRGGKLWVDFQYLGERVREPSGLKDDQANRLYLRKQLDLITAEIENGVFEFAKRFPHSKKKDLFSMLEGRKLRTKPEEVFFSEYVKRWWREMEPGMSENQIRDYCCALENHIIPFFGEMSFLELKPVQMKKFIAQLKHKKNRYEEPLSAKSIRNYLIPLLPPGKKYPVLAGEKVPT